MFIIKLKKLFLADAELKYREFEIPNDKRKPVEEGLSDDTKILIKLYLKRPIEGEYKN